MKASHGFSHLWVGIAAIFLYLINIVLWGIAIKTLPLGSAYAVWTSLGTLIALSIGMLFFNETLSAVKSLFIGMLLIGSIGLTMIKQSE